MAAYSVPHALVAEALQRAGLRVLHVRNNILNMNAMPMVAQDAAGQRWSFLVDAVMEGGKLNYEVLTDVFHGQARQHGVAEERALYLTLHFTREGACYRVAVDAHGKPHPFSFAETYPVPAARGGTPLTEEECCRRFIEAEVRGDFLSLAPLMHEEILFRSPKTEQMGRLACLRLLDRGIRRQIAENRYQRMYFGLGHLHRGGAERCCRVCADKDAVLGAVLFETEDGLLRAVTVLPPEETANVVVRYETLTEGQAHHRFGRLVLAADQGDEETLHRLLADGVPPDAVPDGGRDTALKAAAQLGHTACVRMLLAAGADPLAGYYNSTPLHFAVNSGSLETVQLLAEEGLNLRVLEHASFSGLWKPGGQGRDILRYLLDHGLRELPKALNNLLESAARHGRREEMQLLVEEYGADAVAVLRYQWSIAWGAAPSPHLARWMADKGYFPEPNRRILKKILLRAALNGWTEWVQMMLDWGVNVNCRHARTHATPLMLAVIGGQTAVFSLLLQAGANVFARDARGRTAMSLARERWRFPTLREQLLAAGVPDEAPPHVSDLRLMDAVERADLAMVRYQLENGADVNHRSHRSRYTPLMAAAERGASNIVRLLLRAGAAPALRDRKGRTAHTRALNNATPDKELLRLLRPAEASTEPENHKSE